MWQGGAANRVVIKNNNTLFYVNAASSLEPTQQLDYDDITVIASNTHSSHSTTISSPAPVFAGAVFKLKPNNAIADSGATQIFVIIRSSTMSLITLKTC